MNQTDRFRRLETLFHAALNVASDQRDTFLKNECGDDEVLLHDVQKLLEREQGGTALGILSSFDAGVEEPIDIAGERVGAYEIKSELGIGGMGTVYLASRADDAYQKDVAIKVVRDRLSQELIDRFRIERQILATLEHPNIARLVDGGTTDDGFPYVVMEYVRGRTIDEFCDLARLTVRQRLELFLQVCDAVQFAHRNLIVHRDIKPQNILVTGAGTPKLLDFGIAKLLTRGLEPGPAGLTVAAARRMTPAYASPEQVRGEPVTTSSDVYSLGVLLYELLTGCPPYQTATQSLVDVERTICDSEPLLPSSCVTSVDDRRPGQSADAVARARSTHPQRLQSLLSGDLDNILMMALRKEPQRRYVSAEALGDDIERYLTHRPVAARTDTWGYRTAKFVRRNRVAVAATVVVAASILTAAAVSVNFAISESRQRTLAEQRFEDVRELATTFLYDIHDTLANEGLTATRGLLVSTGTDYLDALDAQDTGDPSLKQDIARGYIRMAQVQGDPASASRGDSETAIKNVVHGMSIVDDLLERSPGDVSVMLIAAEGHQVFASLSRHEQDLRSSIEQFDEALHLRQDIAKRYPDLALERPRLDSIYWSYAQTMANSGRHRESIQLYEQAVNLLTDLVPRHPERRDLADLLLNARAFHAQAYQRAGEFDETRNLLEPLIDDIEQALTERPASNRLTEALAAARVNLGRVYDAQGDHARAEPQLLSSLELHERLSTSDPQNIMMWLRVSVSHHFLGKLYDNMGRFEQALDHFAKMLQTNRKIAERDPTSLIFRRQYAVALDMTGFALRKLKRNEEALDRHSQANHVFVELSRSRPDDVDAQRGVAVSWYFLGQLELDMALDDPSDSPSRNERLRRAIRDFNAARDIMISIRDEGNLPSGDSSVIDMLSGEIEATQAVIDQALARR